MFKRLHDWWMKSREPQPEKLDIVEQLMLSDPYTLSRNQRRIYDEINRLQGELASAQALLDTTCLDAEITEEVKETNPWLHFLYRTNPAFRKTADEGGTIEDCLMDVIARGDEAVRIAATGMPVIVLPESPYNDDDHHDAAYDIGWDRCIEAVKRSNAGVQFVAADTTKQESEQSNG